jgi:hypothetical protein
MEKKQKRMVNHELKLQLVSFSNGVYSATQLPTDIYPTVPGGQHQGQN